MTTTNPPPQNYGQWAGGTHLIVIYRWQHHEISFLWEKVTGNKVVHSSDIITTHPPGQT